MKERGYRKQRWRRRTLSTYSEQSGTNQYGKEGKSFVHAGWNRWMKVSAVIFDKCQSRNCKIINKRKIDIQLNDR